MRDFQSPGRSTVYAANGMAATSHPLAALVAIETLKSGGNAIDAAIAGAVLLGTCEPQMTGLGGDLFILFTDPKTGEIRGLNGSGRAPAGLDPEKLRANGHQTVPVDGALSVSVPGAVDAFCHLSDNWGKLGLPALLAPAIRYADEGVPVSPRVAFDWALKADNLTGVARDTYLSNGAAPEAGALFRQPGQAEVLRRIAAEGRAGFYEGEVAEDMVASLKAAGGPHTLDDFAAVSCDPSTPVEGRYGPFDVIEHPPNGQGAAAILLMNILGEFDLAALPPGSAQRVHLEAEATKLAYDARNRFVADPAHTTRTDYLMAPETARALAALIDPGRAMDDATRISEQVHRDTIYITVVDKDRMAVSLIYSIFRSFGSGLASDKFGVLFHNRGSGFSLTQGHPNEAGPGKRPMHTIIPGFLRSPDALMPFGVMGGPYQAAGHARFVTNLADYGMELQDALDAPRSFAWQGELRLERGYGDAVAATLADMGHNVVRPEEPIGGAQAIRMRSDGVLEGASDPRKDGCALGY